MPASADSYYATIVRLTQLKTLTTRHLESFCFLFRALFLFTLVAAFVCQTFSSFRSLEQTPKLLALMLSQPTRFLRNHNQATVASYVVQTHRQTDRHTGRQTDGQTLTRAQHAPLACAPIRLFENCVRNVHFAVVHITAVRSQHSKKVLSFPVLLFFTILYLFTICDSQSSSLFDAPQVFDLIERFLLAHTLRCVAVQRAKHWHRAPRSCQSQIQWMKTLFFRSLIKARCTDS